MWLVQDWIAMKDLFQFEQAFFRFAACWHFDQITAASIQRTLT
jgi:hypothetical protein